MKLQSYIGTALALGPVSIFRALRYRFGLKAGINPVRRLKATSTQGPYFRIPSEINLKLTSNSNWRTHAYAFGHIPIAISDKAPNWHTNVLSGQKVHEPMRPWWKISDFDPSIGDIKGVWELSRFDWVLAFAQQASTGEEASLERLNHWLEDWCQQNPPYHGPNWKCGQEASIRVMHLAMAALILRQADSPLPSLLSLIGQHLDRIAPTITYAIAQDNNHGTSEAAALFIGGSWLAVNGDRRGLRLQRIGRKWLENRAIRLIEADGTFSQYSVTYHRVMLDTYSMVELWRQHQNLPSFSPKLYEKLCRATEWLYTITNPTNGDAPNIGANDGARLLPLTDTDYRDFRPTLHLAGKLFSGASGYSPPTPSEDPFCWLISASHCTKSGSNPGPPKSKLFDNGGFAVLHAKNAMAVLRYPRFRFRPSHADCLHIDLWVGEENLLRDGGTYSYNTANEWLSYFPGTASHNTVQFDGRDQMPKLSRFLFGNWIRTKHIDPFVVDKDVLSFGAEYNDEYGASHRRSLKLSDKDLYVEDQIAGFKESAVLRWRLTPHRTWRLQDNMVTDGVHCLTITSTTHISSITLKHGTESRYYGSKSDLSVLEVEVRSNCRITSHYSWR
ncbi:heparinase [Pigmentiphaga sp. NML080357]|uniref:heparinase II/III family protein n=1 Tax=Pigmentiphaga sp. NML080357 TaxID=2008675 RepID=UPI000B4077E1|nr:heparinase II/III-family protein [Pigmentiphaga sp. NML080357]OVZ59504.1 heparinase [Pigmentiphaga sp. NML080357]